MLSFYWMFSSSSALQLRENTGSWKLKSTFGCCRFEYIKMMHGDASLWESFPQALERQTGARRYVGAFRAPFQDLRLAPSQEHALRVCSSWPSLPRLVIRGRCRGGCPKICWRTIYRPGRIPCRTSRLG